MIGLLLTVVGAIAFWVAVFEIIGWFIVGMPNSEKTLDGFFEANLDKYELSDIGRDMFYTYPDRLPFIARTPLALLSKWYVNDNGPIYRWSKWSGRLDEKRRKALEGMGPRTKNIRDLYPSTLTEVRMEELQKGVHDIIEGKI